MSQKHQAAYDGVSDLLHDSEDTAVRYSQASALQSEPPSMGRFQSSPPPSGDRSRPSTAPTESVSDSTLSRYFRDMATHQVMGPDEELTAAQSVEDAEIEYWCALLSYLPSAETVLDTLQQDMLLTNEEERPQAPQVLELKALMQTYRKQRSKLHADQMRDWT